MEGDPLSSGLAGHTGWLTLPLGAGGECRIVAFQKLHSNRVGYIPCPLASHVHTHSHTTTHTQGKDPGSSVVPLLPTLYSLISNLRHPRYRAKSGPAQPKSAGVTRASLTRQQPYTRIPSQASPHAHTHANLRTQPGRRRGRGQPAPAPACSAPAWRPRPSGLAVLPPVSVRQGGKHRDRR